MENKNNILHQQKEKINCLIQGPVSTVSGYGAHCRDIVRALIKKYPKWNIQIVDTRWGNTPRNYLKKNRDNDIITRLYRSNTLKEQPDIFIPVLIPNEFQPIGKFNVGITAGIETTLCSYQWLQGLNKMDLNIVPSQHAANVFKNTIYTAKTSTGKDAGKKIQLQKPIEVLFEGVNTDIYYKTDNIMPSIKKIMAQVEENFAFLTVGHWITGNIGHDRKNIGATIQVFCDTFKTVPPNKRPALILKVSRGTFSISDREQVLKLINAIRYDDSLPNVYLIHGDLTDKEMNCLYNHPKIKAMLSFTHGEGYGRPLAEFAVSKKPIIAPKWSGQIDFLNDQYSVLLEGELKQVHRSAVKENIILPQSKWFYVDYYKASKAMVNVWQNYKQYKQKANKQSEIIWKEKSWNKMTDKLQQILEQYMPVFNEEIELTLPKLHKINEKEKNNNNAKEKL